jgi:hypothetical protein
MVALTATEGEIMEVVRLLNARGMWITLQQCLAMAECEIYQNKEKQTKAAGEFQKVGNTIYPKWA